MLHFCEEMIVLHSWGYPTEFSLLPSSPQVSHRDSSCQTKTEYSSRFEFAGELKGKPHSLVLAICLPTMSSFVMGCCPEVIN